MKLAFFDIETTGFSRDYDDIIELAAIAYDTELNEEYEMFHTFVKPKRKIPKKIIDLTGIDNSMVENAPAPWDALPQFFAWMKAYGIEKIVAHNGAVFDWPFIRNKCQQLNINCFQEYELIDTLKIARKLNKNGVIKTENNQQPTLAHYFGFTYVPHTAIEDCRALVDVWKSLAKLDS